MCEATLLGLRCCARQDGQYLLVALSWMPEENSADGSPYAGAGTEIGNLLPWIGSPLTYCVTRYEAGETQPLVVRRKWLRSIRT